jgi:hypothetical protein
LNFLSGLEDDEEAENSFWGEAGVLAADMLDM